MTVSIASVFLITIRIFKDIYGSDSFIQSVVHRNSRQPMSSEEQRGRLLVYKFSSVCFRHLIRNNSNIFNVLGEKSS